MKYRYLLIAVILLILLTSCGTNTDTPVGTKDDLESAVTQSSTLSATSSTEPDITTTDYVETSTEETTTETVSTTEETTERETVVIGGSVNEEEEETNMSKEYTTEEIIDIFEKEREAFEAIKDIFLEKNYRLRIEKKASTNNLLSFHNYGERDENRRDIYYPIEELEGYETIIDFLIKYDISTITGSAMSNIDDNRIQITMIEIDTTDRTNDNLIVSPSVIHQYIIYSVKDQYSNPENNPRRGIKLGENWYYQRFVGT